MSRPFHLETLRVGRLPGIDAPFQLPPLSPGLNLVFGPNASGKSSVLRAIEAALWPSAHVLRDFTVTATAHDGRDQWRVHIDAGHVAITRNGTTATALDMPAPTLRHRYRLALHDLLAATETGVDFAAAIARASVGGVDLSAAAQALSLNDKPSRSPTARAEWDAARAESAQAQARQQALHREAQQLASLEAEVASAREARDATEMWRAAARWLEARDAAGVARAALAQLPDGVARLDARDAQAAEQLCEEWRRNRTAHAHELQRQANAATAASEAFPETVPDAATREQWRALRSSWRDADDAVVRSAAARDQAAAQEQELLRAISAGTNDATAGASAPAASRHPALDATRVPTPHTISAFADFAREAAEAQAERITAAAECRRLAAMPSSGLPEGFADRARDGLRLLTRWLSVGVPDAEEVALASVPPATTVAATAQERAEQGTFDDTRTTAADWLLLVAAVLAWTVLAITWHPAAGLGVLFSMALAWWRWQAARAAAAAARAETQRAAELAAAAAVEAFARQRRSRTEQERTSLRREFESLTLPEPASWAPDAVYAHLTTLNHDLVRAARDAQRAEELSVATARRDAAEERLQLVAAKRQSLVQEHQLVPALRAQGMHAESLRDEALHWFVERLARWHDARSARLAAEAQLAHSEAQRTRALQEFVDLCTPLGVRPGATVAAADAQVADLESRYERHREVLREREQATQALHRLHGEGESLQRAWEALVAPMALGIAALPDTLNAEGEQTVRQALTAVADLLEHRPAFLTHTEALEAAQRDMAEAARVGGEARQRLGAADDTPVADSWAKRSVESVQDALAEAEARAADYQPLVEQLATLRHRLDDAGRTDAVERALDRCAVAQEALSEQFDNSVRSMVGHALVEHVRTESRDVDRPQVFHRARALFARFTHGEWQLQLDDAAAQEPVFSAVEVRTGRPVALEHLSGGTRVQLLVAVRVAFVEHEEHDRTLPLLLDETLGTTDDVRAHAFMDAMLSLAADGRQLFYCTAQQDEVEHWRAALEARASGAAAVPCQEIDMAAVRALPAGDHLPAARSARTLVPPAITVQVPDISGHSHHSYGNALGVRPIVPGTTLLGDTHLWYLFESLPVLRAALSVGTDAWGPFTFYLEQGGALRVPDMETASVHHALARAEQLARAIAVLHRESAIGIHQPITRHALLEAPLSEPQRESVGALADACDGDVNELLQQLADKAITGFGTRRIETLREWMLERGLLDERDRRSPVEVRLAMLASSAGALDAAAVDALLARIAARAGELSRKTATETPPSRGAVGGPTPQLEAFQSGTDERADAD